MRYDRIDSFCKELLRSTSYSRITFYKEFHRSFFNTIIINKYIIFDTYLQVVVIPFDFCEVLILGAIDVGTGLERDCGRSVRKAASSRTTKLGIGMNRFLPFHFTVK